MCVRQPQSPQMSIREPGTSLEAAWNQYDQTECPALPLVSGCKIAHFGCWEKQLASSVLNSILHVYQNMCVCVRVCVQK